MIGTRWRVTVVHDGAQWRGTISRRTLWLFTAHVWHCLCGTEEECRAVTFRKLKEFLREEE